MAVFSFLTLPHLILIFYKLQIIKRVFHALRKLIKLIKLSMNTRQDINQTCMTAPISPYIQHKTILNKANTHKVINHYHLLESIKEYEHCANKQKQNRGLNRVQTSLIGIRQYTKGAKVDRNAENMSLYNKNSTARVSSVHLQRAASKEPRFLKRKQPLIDKQVIKMKTIENHITSSNIQRPFSTIQCPKHQSFTLLQPLKSSQKPTVREISRPIQHLNEPLQRKLKIFRQKFKMTSSVSKRRHENDKQHKEIQRITDNLQKDSYIATYSKVKSQDEVNSTKEQVYMPLLDSQCLEKKDKDDNGLFKRSREAKEKKLLKKEQRNNALHRFQNSSLLKLALNQKLQLNLDYLNKKPLLKGRYQILQKLGKGLSGQVFKAKDILSERLVAVKVIINSMKDEQYSFYKDNQHKNIVSYYNNFVYNSTRYLILQYFPYTLESYSRHYKLDEVMIKTIFKSIASGLSFLHAMSIAHRDIKLSNIVLSEQLQEVKFIDFGLCIDIAKCQNGLTKEFCGTIRYMPPEILQKQPYNPRKADIWSLGVVLYFLVHSRYPYNGRGELDMLEKMSKGKLILKEDLSCSLKELLRGMLTKKVNERLTIIQILQNKWLN